jgi:FkbM family methyltransferase
LFTLKNDIKALFKFVPSNVAFPIVRGPLKSSKWISGAAPGEAKGLSVLFNLSENAQIKQAMKFLKKDAVCFDVGANVGMYSLLFAKYSRFVYAFEPLPRNISYLKRTLQINNVENVCIVSMAMACATGVMHFQEGNCNSEGKLCEDGKLTVNTISCDDFVSNHEAPNLVKIDVEGAELSVLQGAKNTLLEHTPNILLSTHSQKLKNDCLDLLRSMDYTVRPIEKTTIKTASTVRPIETASEFLAVPNEGV